MRRIEEFQAATFDRQLPDPAFDRFQFVLVNFKLYLQVRPHDVNPILEGTSRLPPLHRFVPACIATIVSGPRASDHEVDSIDPFPRPPTNKIWRYETWLGIVEGAWFS